MKLIFAIVTACLLVLVSPSVEAQLAGNTTCRWYPIIVVYQADNIHYNWRMEWNYYDNKTRNKTFRRGAVLDTF